MNADNTNSLAEPFAQIFTDRAEANWAFDLLRDSVKRLGISGPYDPRFALTLLHHAGKLCLHLNFGRWLVLGFRGPGRTSHRVEMALLAEQISWDERFVALSSDRKEGEPEVRSYHLPLETVRPMTSDLQAAYETTLDFIADKFRTWKRSPYWKQHNPEIVEALFDLEKRERLFAGLFDEKELRYERHFTTFHQEIGEEEALYEVDSTLADEDEMAPVYEAYSERPLQRRSDMNLDREKIKEMVSLVRQWYPNWSGFSDPDFMKDEIDYKQATIIKARELLSEAELKRLITENGFDDFIDRLDKIGKNNNLLWQNVPTTGDLNILYHPELDKSTFCKAIFDLLYGPGESPDRLERYTNYVQDKQLPNKWTFPTYFLFMCHPKTEIFVKPRTTRWFVKFFGSQGAYTAKPTASAYATIRQMAQQLMDGLQTYEPRDMVDIQSFIWVCRPAKQRNGEKEGENEKELAEPFSQIFIDREEAEWAFGFLLETCKRLGIESADDQRFALTLRHGKSILKKRTLRLNFGSWAVLSFYGPDIALNRVSIPFIVDQANLDEKFISFDFAQDDKPDIREYTLPIDMVESFEDDLRKAHEATFDYIAQKFGNWKRCRLWKHHVPEIAEAVFDLEKREKLFDEGLSKETQELLEVQEDEDEDKLHIGVSPYPLSQLAADTGFDEPELARWVRAIERKKQAILYGPPGTGKTFIAEKLAQHLIGGGDGFSDLVQFHPAYAYEDFIQGLRPIARPEGGLDYRLVPGRFLEFCQKAQTRQDRCVLIIDEINRANLARVFGELMYLLEYRDREIPLAGGGALQIPANVRLIGAMNTADRSIALVDHALRRRFAFLALYPNYAVLRRYHQQKQTGFPIEGLIDVLTRLNRQIDDLHYAVGITFFLHEELSEQIEDVWRMEIEPYLEEYFFDQPEKVEDFRWEVIKQEVASYHL